MGTPRCSNEHSWPACLARRGPSGAAEHSGGGDGLRGAMGMAAAGAGTSAAAAA